MSGQVMQKQNDKKCIINGKYFYINEKNLKGNLREIYLSSRRQAKWRFWWGEHTAACQILVVLPFAIHVLMQRMSTKIMPNCSISCNEITQLT
jgi:hypothetical protein